MEFFKKTMLESFNRGTIMNNEEELPSYTVYPYMYGRYGMGNKPTSFLFRNTPFCKFFNGGPSAAKWRN